MKTIANKDIKNGTVKKMREIREQISSEIKDMTFAQERAYLDRLLVSKKGGKKSSAKELH